MSLKVELVEVSDFQQNCRIVSDISSKRAVVIDPGGDYEKILARLNASSLTLEAIYLTHSHIDHCGAVAPLMKVNKVPLFAHASEQSMRQNVTTVAAMYGLKNSSYFNCPEPDIYLEDGQELEIVGVKAKVISAPGHSPGSICLWMPSEGMIFSGDVLFYRSIGRTDLPGGDHATLLASIKKLIGLLPGETKVLSGHGPDTTIAQEKEENPFL